MSIAVEHSYVATRRHEHHPKKVSGAMSLLRRGREDVLLQGPSAVMNKAPKQVKSSRSHGDASQKKRRYALNPDPG